MEKLKESLTEIRDLEYKSSYNSTYEKEINVLNYSPHCFDHFYYLTDDFKSLELSPQNFRELSNKE